jgi:hypothetical protein
MRGVNIADMAVEMGRTRLAQVVAGLVVVGIAAPLFRRAYARTSQF